MEQSREGIDAFLHATNDVLYGLRLRLVDVLRDPRVVVAGLALVLAVVAIIVLARRARVLHRRAVLLGEVVEGCVAASTLEAVADMIFGLLFRAVPVPAACAYVSAAPGSPFVLRFRQTNPSCAAASGPDWDPPASLSSVPSHASLASEGAMFVCSVPVAIEGRPVGLLRMVSATEGEGRRALAAAPFLQTLLAVPLARLVAFERIRRLEEQAAEATVVSGASRTLFNTALEPDELAGLLLELMLRATGGEAGAVVVSAGRTLACRAPDTHVLSLLSPAILARRWPSRDALVRLERSDDASDAVLLAAGFGSLLEAPLVLDEGPAGAIVLLRRAGTFVDNHRRIVRLNAARLALALRNRQFHETVFSDYKDTLRAVVATFEASASHVEHHSLRVARLAVDLAVSLGLPEPEAEGLRLAGELHDVGMTGLGDDILFKSGRLSPQEYDLVRHHPVIGAAMTAPVHRPVAIAPLVMHHHERWDGQGYPDGLRGEEIPLGARILALGEVFDAMVTARSYRAALTFSEAVRRLRGLAGGQLDPRIVQAHLDTVTEDRWQAISRKPE